MGQYPGYRTMTGAQRRNERMHRMFADARARPVTHFVFIIAPCDQSLVGPFPTENAAIEFSKTLPKEFDAYVWNEAEKNDNFAQFGEMKMTAPPV